MKKHRAIVMGSVLNVAGFGASVLVGFFLMPFVVHRLGDRMYGYWSLVGALLGYYGVLDLGITPAVSFHMAKAMGEGNEESQNRTLSAAVAGLAAIGLAVLVIAAVLAAACPFFIKHASDARVFQVVLLITGLGCAFGFPGRAFQAGLYAHLRNDLIAVVNAVVLAVRTVLVVWAILSGWGIVGLALVSFITDALTYVACYFILRRIQHGLRISFSLVDRKALRELFNYGQYSMVMRIGDQLRFAVDGWVVAAFVGVAAVAHYAIASRLSSYYLTVMLNAVGLLPPWFSQMLGSGNEDGMRRLVSLSTRIAAALSTIIACSFIFYGRAFIEEWMGARYVDAYWPALILMLALYCDLAQQPSVSYLLGVSKHRYLAIQTLLEGVANLVLSIYWARSYGMIGVAMGTLVPMFVAKVLLQPPYVCRSAGISLLKYYVKDLGAGILAPAICAITFWTFLRNVHFSSLATVSLVIGVQAAIGCIATFFFVCGANDRQMIGRAVWKRSTTEANTVAMEV
ncbi:MAG TPA: oligosaccharide flippase family protein [Candidatus Acidoferrum sp.]|nr:oligosaccharide flippase family protein [Candidatus Acidoferrum sp.]